MILYNNNIGKQKLIWVFKFYVGRWRYYLQNKYTYNQSSSIGQIHAYTKYMGCGCQIKDLILELCNSSIQS